MLLWCSECRLLSHCHHPNIIRTDGLFSTATSKVLLLELCQHGDLESRITQIHNYTEADARKICRVLLETIVYLHETVQIVHCDIKPQNLLLATDLDPNSDNPFRDCLRLCDFGYAHPVYTDIGGEKGLMLSHICGSQPFLAPELVPRNVSVVFKIYLFELMILCVQRANTLFGKPVDIWAFGVTVYYLLSGTYPFTITVKLLLLLMQVLFPHQMNAARR